MKGGHQIGSAMVRDLNGMVERKGARFGIFVCMREPTPKMKKEAASSGMTEMPLGTKHPKIQIYTIKDYFDGRLPNLPQINNVVSIIRLYA